VLERPALQIRIDELRDAGALQSRHDDEDADMPDVSGEEVGNHLRHPDHRVDFVDESDRPSCDRVLASRKGDRLGDHRLRNPA
jgi:hypothetical protein